MKTTPIPSEAIKGAARIAKKNAGHLGWWHVAPDKLPKEAIECVTTNGYYKAGLRAWIVSGNEREIYVGEGKNTVKQTIPEFTLILEGGSQFLAQYGRDFRFLDVAA